MRQVGILAAAGLYCLDNMIERLADDHRNAKLVASAVAALNSPVISVELNKVQTNMVLLQVDTRIPASDVCDRFAQITDKEQAEIGDSIKVLAWPRTENKIRLVFHCDVSEEQARLTAAKIAYVVKEFTGKIN
jgi:threonine aldolase